MRLSNVWHRRSVVVGATVVASLGLSIGIINVASADSTSTTGSTDTSAAAPLAKANGTYSYNDSVGDTNETLTVKGNGTVKFESGCTGIWVQQGSSFSMDINAHCTGQSWIFVGTITKKGLNSVNNPGNLETDGTPGTWYATSE
jgi:hypothetical protein